MPKSLEDCTTDELIQIVRELRKENGDRRASGSRYDQAFSQLAPDIQEGLLGIISVFADDREAGADLFRQLADSITSPTRTTEEGVDPMTDTAGDGQTQGPGQGEDVLAQILAHLEKMEERVVAIETGQQSAAEAEEQRQANEVIQVVTGLGYERGSPEWDAFLDLAASDFMNGDLDRAHAAFPAMYPQLAWPGTESDQSNEQQDTDTSTQTEEPETNEFPNTSGRASAGGPKLSANNGEEPTDYSRAATDARALEYLEKLQAQP